MPSTGCKYYAERTLGWMLNNKVIVLLSLLSFSLFVSTLVFDGQITTLKRQLVVCRTGLLTTTTAATTTVTTTTTTTTVAPPETPPAPVSTTVAPEETTTVAPTEIPTDPTTDTPLPDSTTVAPLPEGGESRSLLKLLSGA